MGVPYPRQAVHNVSKQKHQTTSVQLLEGGKCSIYVQCYLMETVFYQFLFLPNLLLILWDLDNVILKLRQDNQALPNNPLDFAQYRLLWLGSIGTCELFVDSFICRKCEFRKLPVGGCQEVFNHLTLVC